MKKIVKCPLCGKIQQTRGKVYFRCCGVAWDVEKHRVSDLDETRYRVPKRTLDEYLEELSEDEIRKLVKEILGEMRSKDEI